MAHYASSCWYLEMYWSYSWTECAGLAECSAFDFAHHLENSGNELTAREVLLEPRDVERLIFALNKGEPGRAVRKNEQVIMKEMDDMDENVVSVLRTKMEKDGKSEMAGIDIFKEHVTFKNENRRVIGFK